MVSSDLVFLVVPTGWTMLDVGSYVYCDMCWCWCVCWMIKNVSDWRVSGLLLIMLPSVRPSVGLKRSHEKAMERRLMTRRGPTPRYTRFLVVGTASLLPHCWLCAWPLSFLHGGSSLSWHSLCCPVLSCPVLSCAAVLCRAVGIQPSVST